MSSVRVSWDQLPINEIIHYVIFYQLIVNGKKQAIESIIVKSTESSVNITDLIIGAEYQFQVEAQAVVDGTTIFGQRSARIHKSLPEVIFPTATTTTVTTTTTIGLCKCVTYTTLYS